MAKIPERFIDVTTANQSGFRIGFRSGLTVYEEALVDGQYVSLGWNGAGYLSSVITKPTIPCLDITKFAEPHAFQLNVDGQSLSSHWIKGSFEKSEVHGKIHTVLELHHAVRPIRVRIHTIVDGSPILTRWLEIINQNKISAALSSVSPWSGGMQSTKHWQSYLESGSSLYSLGYMADTHWGNEGRFQWITLPNATLSISGRYLRDRFRHPMFVLQNHATGELFMGQLGWSGGYTFAFDLNCDLMGQDDLSAHLAFRSGPDGPEPLRVLGAGETVQTPAMHLGMVLGGLDDGIQAMHDHIRRSVFTTPSAFKDGAPVESGIGPEVDMDEASVFHQLNMAAALGAEVFFIDAGWYTPPRKESEWHSRVGTWTVDTDRHPNGVGPIREKAHELGMLFGMWMEPERIGTLSNIFSEHPDWMMKDYRGQNVRGNPGLLDLGNPTVAHWVEEQITHVIVDYQVDFFRLDYNIGDIQAGGCTIRDEYIENNYWRYYEQFDRILTEMRGRFPHVIFENCASGGGRTDLATVAHFNHTWVTDWQLAPRSFSITNGMTMALPPEYIDRLVAGQSGHVSGDLNFQLRQVLFGRPTLGQFNPLGSPMNSLQMAMVRHVVDLYKNFVRPFMPGSRIYHHTPEMTGAEPTGWGVLELASRDQSKAIVGVFRLSDTLRSPKEITIRMRGLNSSHAYRVRWDNHGYNAERPGYSLTEEGVCVCLESALTSELLLFERV
jgi:alpha-galactosidase